jgi:Coenzyme PQQ synthesis protein D (PqqD)
MREAVRAGSDADADRPRRVAGTEVTELDQGLLVRPAGPASEPAHELNNTASIVWELCDGRRSVPQIAAALAGAFGLAALPLAETGACVAQLRDAGILARPDNPFDFFEAIYCLNLDERTDRWEGASRRFSALGIASRTERFPAIPTPQNHHVGCAISWRRMVVAARERGLRNFLGIEDDAIFLDDTLPVLQRCVSELAEMPWDLLYLGGATWQPPTGIAGHTGLQAPHGLTCTHALAVSATAYDRLLADIPEADGIDEWIAAFLAIDQYLSRSVDAGLYRAYVVNPRIATQQELTFSPDLDGPLRDRYTIR